MIIFLLSSCKENVSIKSATLENMTLKCGDSRDGMWTKVYSQIFIIHNDSFDYTASYGIGNSIIENKKISSKESIITIEFTRNEKNQRELPNIKIDSKWEINRYTGDYLESTIYYRKDGTKDEDHSNGNCIKEEISKKF